MKIESGPRVRIKKVTPIFRWIKCNKCGMEFRFERIWKVKPTPREYAYYRLKSSSYIYYCPDCAATKLDVLKETYYEFLKRNGVLNVSSEEEDLFSPIPERVRKEIAKPFKKPAPPPAPPKKE